MTYRNNIKTPYSKANINRVERRVVLPSSEVNKENQNGNKIPNLHYIKVLILFNNLFKINYKYKICTLLIPALLFISCSNPKFEKSYFIGSWNGPDGANIILKKDGSCTLKNLDSYKIYAFPENENEKLNSMGKWNLINDVESGIIDGIDSGIAITFKIPERNGEAKITFYISGQGALGNKEPWNFFIWDGDPDDMIKYEFKK